MHERQSWDEYFLDIAKTISTRSTCTRKKVGCVVVKDKAIIATGYNGSLPGARHCEDAKCLMKDGHCIRTIHSETNAIAQAAKNGNSCEGASIYITHSPCNNCLKNIIVSGIKMIIWSETYKEHPKEFLNELGYSEFIHFSFGINFIKIK